MGERSGIGGGGEHLLPFHVGALHEVDVHALAGGVDANIPADLAEHRGASNEVISDTDGEGRR